MSNAWMADADCLQLDPDEFFTNNGVKAFCYKCPVRNDCLRHAYRTEDGIEDRLVYGVYGGYSPRERTNMRKRYGLADIMRRLDGDDPVLAEAWEPFRAGRLAQLAAARGKKQSAA